MLSVNAFYVDYWGQAYVIEKITEKTVLFTPVKSEYVGREEGGSAFFYDAYYRAIRENDPKGKKIRFKLSNNFSTKGLACFQQGGKGMFELEDDAFTRQVNLG